MTPASTSESIGQPRAFVSHSTKDRAFVEALATNLRANGVEAWYSEWEIKPGGPCGSKDSAARYARCKCVSDRVYEWSGEHGEKDGLMGAGD
jgi:hypothetical protein